MSQSQEERTIPPQAHLSKPFISVTLSGMKESPLHLTSCLLVHLNKFTVICSFHLLILHQSFIFSSISLLLMMYSFYSTRILQQLREIKQFRIRNWSEKRQSPHEIKQMTGFHDLPEEPYVCKISGCVIVQRKPVAAFLLVYLHRVSSAAPAPPPSHSVKGKNSSTFTRTSF